MQTKNPLVNQDLTKPARSQRGWLVLALAAFIVMNVSGMGFITGVVAIMACVSIFIIVTTPNNRTKEGFPQFLPSILFCLGVFVFHFAWGKTWQRYGVPDVYVATALLIVIVAIWGAYLGGRFVDKVRIGDEKHRDIYDRQIYFLIALIFLLIGWLSRWWAIGQRLWGYAYFSQGIDFAIHTGSLVTTILSFSEFVGIGQVVLLLLLLDDRREHGYVSGHKSWKVFLVLILGISMVFDFGYRFQSAAKGTLLIGTIPLLLTLYISGHRRLTVDTIIGGALAYTMLVSPLMNAVRYNRAYTETISQGSFYLPSLDYLQDSVAYDRVSINESLSRFNQTNLLAFTAQQFQYGLPKLWGTSYEYALATLAPRALFPGRIDRQVPYDIYTGYALSRQGGYNNWGIHTEAYLNFGIVGVVIVMSVIGMLWQTIYTWLLRFDRLVGWAIAASIWLPSIFRAGEYGFLAAVVSVLKSLFFSVVIAQMCLIAARVVLKPVSVSRTNY